MNFKRILVYLLSAAAMMVCVQWAYAQGQSETAATAPPPQAMPPQAASPIALRLVDKDASGRDAQGNMRIKLIDGGVKLPAKP